MCENVSPMKGIPVPLGGSGEDLQSHWPSKADLRSLHCLWMLMDTDLSTRSGSGSQPSVRRWRAEILPVTLTVGSACAVQSHSSSCRQQKSDYDLKRVHSPRGGMYP